MQRRQRSIDLALVLYVYELCLKVLFRTWRWGVIFAMVEEVGSKESLAELNT
jgi:hypothetical protein